MIQFCFDVYDLTYAFAVNNRNNMQLTFNYGLHVLFPVPGRSAHLPDEL